MPVLKNKMQLNVASTVTNGHQIQADITRPQPLKKKLKLCSVGLLKVVLEDGYLVYKNVDARWINIFTQSMCHVYNFN